EKLVDKHQQRLDEPADARCASGPTAPGLRPQRAFLAGIARGLVSAPAAGPASAGEQGGHRGAHRRAPPARTPPAPNARATPPRRRGRTLAPKNGSRLNEHVDRIASGADAVAYGELERQLRRLGHGGGDQGGLRCFLAIERDLDAL